MVYRGAVDQPSITCPRCLMTSHNPNDIAQGYCAYCAWWTSDEALGQAMLDGRHRKGCVRPQCIGCEHDRDKILPA